MQHAVTPESIAHGRVIAQWVLGAVITGYFFPTIVAILRRTHWGGVLVFNLALGWSGLGWIIALAMACSAIPRAPREPRF